MAEDQGQRFDDLYRENVRAVLGYALTRASPEDAKDVVSKTFLVAWRRMEDVPSDGLPWLLGVARKTLAEERRSAGRRDALGKRLANDALVATDSGWEDIADGPIKKDEIRMALKALRSEDQEILTFVAWQGLSAEQLTVVLGCSKATAAVRLHRARRRFAKHLVDASAYTRSDPLDRPVTPITGDVR